MTQTFLRKNKKRLSLTALCCLSLSLLASAQNRYAAMTSPVNATIQPVDSLPGSPIEPPRSGISSYDAAKSRVSLFLHLDKSIYQPGESIWFTGYILNRNFDLMKRQNTLYVLLADAETKQPALRQRFYIQNGIAEGSLRLPDTIATHDFWLIGYTNELFSGTDQPLFRQLITVKGPAGTPFRLIAQSIDSSAASADTLKARFKFGTSYSGLASGGKFSYTLFAGTDSIGSGQKIIDPYGEVIVPFSPSTYIGKKLELVAAVTRDGLSKNFIISLDPEPVPINAPPHNEARQALKVALSYDSSQYHQRSKVSLHIKITDSTGHGLKGFFSLSVAASRKIDWNRMGNITSFTPGENPLASIDGLAPDGTLDPDKPDYGYVLYLEGKPKKSIPLSIMGSKFAILQTDSSGRFQLPYDKLLVPNGETNYVSVTAPSPQDYQIRIVCKADTLARQLAAVHYPLNFVQDPALSDSDEIKMQTSPETLRAAIVKARITQEYDIISEEYRSKRCDKDFVCTHTHGSMQNPQFLNCPAVKVVPCATTKPVEGQRYLFMPKDAYEPMPHHGMPGMYLIYRCVSPPLPKFIAPMTPIVSSPANFPVQDYSRDYIVGSPQQSTVYWSHLLSTDNNGETTIDFYTNDLTGKFTTTLQGICVEGAIFGKESYVVTP